MHLSTIKKSIDPSKTTNERFQSNRLIDSKLSPFLKVVLDYIKVNFGEQIKKPKLSLVTNALDDYDISALDAFISFLEQQDMDIDISSTLDSAYNKGKKRADIETKGWRTRKGFVEIPKGMFKTKRLELIEQLSKTQFDDLKKSTKNKLVRILADGILKGKTKTRLSEEIRKEVGITRKRARVIAQTEITRAQAEGQLDGLEELGDGISVTAHVEFQSKLDERVCEKCASLHGEVFTIEEAHGVIPVHPRCRCAWIPYEKPVQTRKTPPPTQPRRPTPPPTQPRRTTPPPTQPRRR